MADDSEHSRATSARLNQGRLFIGWGLVIGLSLLELLAALHGKPSALKAYPFAATFVATIGEWVPVVSSFARCAAQVDAGSGLMLALNVVFFPLKLVALLYAHPLKIANQHGGWRAAWGNLYAALIAAVALVPVYQWGWVFAPGDIGLASINRKTSALCDGGVNGFFVACLQGGFALLCAYVSLTFFACVARSAANVGRGKY